jgi:hypothetical protein
VRTRAAFLAIALLVVGIVAWVVASDNWRDELPRSTIAAVALGVIALAVLWLFGSSGWKAALGILSAIGVILVTAGTALDLQERLPDGPAPVGALVDCPRYPAGAPADGYVAETELGYTHVRARPNLHSKVLLRYPPGCRLGFESFCLGEPKDDWRFDVQDPVWFSLANTDGYVSAADIRAGPAHGPGEPLDCKGGDPAPLMPEITAPLERRLTGPVEIAAAAPNAIQVGFAVFYPEVAGDPDSGTWHQIGVDLSAGNGITADWESRSVPGQGHRMPASVTLLAVPCLGLEFPASDYGTRTYVVVNGGGPTPPRIRPPATSFEAARTMACDNVDR